MRPGGVVTLDVEKAAAGGRMLARHQGQVVLVAGAIPGERVVARIEKASRAIVFAETIEVQISSPDRRATMIDPRCGGCVLAHIGYERQAALKQQIVEDAFGRIGRFPLVTAPAIVTSPERGYRMRARLHVRDGRIGFFREGSHDLCDAVATGQLADATGEWLAHLGGVMRTERIAGIAAIEVAESLAGDDRACHLELRQDADLDACRTLGVGLAGLSAQYADRPEVTVLSGDPAIEDVLQPTEDAVLTVALRRDVRAFFQSNRYLVSTLLQHVVGLVPRGPVVDLYAGVGLFGLALAATRSEAVTLVEGDPIASRDLRRNAEAYANAHVERRRVEAFVASSQFAKARTDATVIVDPPRTGLSNDVVAAVAGVGPRRLIYVSCDPATLARDCRRLLDEGYEIAGMTLFDMFPNTAHIESVVSLIKE
jgi:23S rRNA (uracil1939-C5)-methyltransferase